MPTLYPARQALPSLPATSSETNHQHSLSDEEVSTDGTLLGTEDTESPEEKILHIQSESLASGLSNEEMVHQPRSPDATPVEASGIVPPIVRGSFVEDEDNRAAIDAASSIDPNLGQDSGTVKPGQDTDSSPPHDPNDEGPFSNSELADAVAVPRSLVKMKLRARQRKKALESQLSNTRSDPQHSRENHIHHKTQRYPKERSPSPDRGRSGYRIAERSPMTRLKQRSLQRNSHSENHVAARMERSNSLTFGMQSPVDQVPPKFEKHPGQVYDIQISPQDSISAHSPRGVAWAYRTSHDTDEVLRDVKIRLFHKPRTFYDPLDLRSTETYGTKAFAPAIVEQNHVKNPEMPHVTFDGHFVRIIPHWEPWDDMRSREDHPDFLPNFKLAEYQACEVAGYPIWRHDRECIKCAKPDCQRMTSDFNLDTRICAGCGPKSQTRYCSHQHELDDLRNHWKICGDLQLVMPRIIDHSTAPAYFDNLCPAIKERNGIGSFELFRQRHFSIHSQGHYTLFDPVTRRHMTLMWPKTDCNWMDMDGRIERLLNIAFLDTYSLGILRYLYILLRHLISITPLNSKASLQTLKTQFGAEFGTQTFRATNDDPIFPCDCEWFGPDLFENLHLPSCPWRTDQIEQLARGL